MKIYIEFKPIKKPPSYLQDNHCKLAAVSYNDLSMSAYNNFFNCFIIGTSHKPYYISSFLSSDKLPIHYMALVFLVFINFESKFFYQVVQFQHWHEAMAHDYWN